MSTVLAPLVCTPRAAWYALTDAPVPACVVSTPEGREVVNGPEVVACAYTSLLRRATTAALATAPFRGEILAAHEHEVCVLHFLRSGLDFGLREALHDALHLVRHGSAFLSSQRRRGTDGSWRVEEDQYRKIDVPEGAVLLVGDVVATGATLEHGFRTIATQLRTVGGSIRRLYVFTIGCERLETLLTEQDRRLRQSFPTYEGIDGDLPRGPLRARRRAHPARHRAPGDGPPPTRRPGRGGPDPPRGARRAPTGRVRPCRRRRVRRGPVAARAGAPGRGPPAPCYSPAMRGFAPTRRHVIVLLLLLALAGCGGGGSSGDGSLGPLAYTALGASDAVGIGAVPLSNGYVPTLAGRLGAAGFVTTLDNLGINGAHVDDLIADELPDALASAPDVVTIWTGANDLIAGDDPDAFALDLAFLLGQLRAGTGATIYVGDLPDLTQAPLFRDGSDPDVTKARVDAYNLRIHQAVTDAGCVLVELSTITLTDDLTWIDGFHPSNEGHAVIADAYWAEIAPRTLP